LFNVSESKNSNLDTQKVQVNTIGFEIIKNSNIHTR